MGKHLLLLMIVIFSWFLFENVNETNVPIDVRLELYWLMSMLWPEENETYRLKQVHRDPDRISMEYVQVETNIDEVHNNIEYSRIMSIDRFH